LASNNGASVSESKKAKMLPIFRIIAYDVGIVVKAEAECPISSELTRIESSHRA